MCYVFLVHFKKVLPRLDLMGSSPVSCSNFFFSCIDHHFVLVIIKFIQFLISGPFRPLFYFICWKVTFLQGYQDRIKELIGPAIESESMELVDVECLKMNTRWLVRLFIDKERGVTLDDCQKISHLVGDILDVHEMPPGPYTLEVSSPGLDRPLTRDKDFLEIQGAESRNQDRGEDRRN